MKLRVMSDLHLNFSAYEVPFTEDEENTVLILAGDICEVKNARARTREFFEDVTSRFKLVLYVFGNHEYYGTSYLRAHDQFMRECGDLDRLKVLDQDTIVLDGVAFIGTTLWTDMNKMNPLTMSDAKAFMNDYSEIRMGTHAAPYQRSLAPLDTCKDNQVMRDWLWDEVVQAKLDGLKTVVITHHHPSFMGVTEKFKMNSLNPCYCNEMFDEVFENGPDFWFCGHMHDYVEYTINKTRVVCNPRGYEYTRKAQGYVDSYVTEKQETGFKPEMVLDI